MDTNPMDKELLAGAYFGAEFPEADTQGGPDALEQFWENARINSAAGEEIADGLETRKAARIVPPDDAHRLEKRFTGSIHHGQRANRIEKSANGCWYLEFGPNGEMIRAYEVAEIENEVSR